MITPCLKPCIFVSLISACISDTFASDQMPKLPSDRGGRDPKVLSSPVIALDPSDAGAFLNQFQYSKCPVIILLRLRTILES